MNTILIIFLMLFSFLPKAWAQLGAAMPPPNCVGLPGCGSANLNVVGAAAIPIAATILLNTIAVLSLIFIMVGGARYILAFAREEELQRARKSIFWAIVGLLVALSSHKIVMVIITETYISPSTCLTCGTGGGPIFDFLQSVVRIMALLLNVTFLLVIVLGGMRMVYARGAEEEVKKGRDMVIYAIIGAVIINVAPLVIKAILAL